MRSDLRFLKFFDADLHLFNCFDVFYNLAYLLIRFNVFYVVLIVVDVFLHCFTCFDVLLRFLCFFLHFVYLLTFLYILWMFQGGFRDSECRR